MNLHEITSTKIKNRVWEKFRDHHYTPSRWKPSARVFLATEVFNGKEVIVGMSAASSAPGIKGASGAWCSHKVAVLPSGWHSGVWNSSESVVLPDFDKVQMWRAVADAQATLFVEAGHPYFCNAGDAPSELVMYRDDPASGWVATTKHGKPPRDKGTGRNKLTGMPRAKNTHGLVVSHWYVGAKAANRKAS